MPLRSKVKIVAGILVLVISWESAVTYAIVRRHDRKDGAYLKLARGHDAVGRISPDGTGTLIAPGWVITAAHVAVSLGPGKGSITFKNKEYEIAEVVLHPGARKMTPNRPPDVDMALLRLAKPVKKIKPVGIYTTSGEGAGDEAADDEVAKTVLFVGYGDTGDGKSALVHTDGKRRAATNTVERVDADHIYMTFHEPPGGTEFEGVSGPGDSGGPALIDVNGEWMIAGVSSASSGKPGRYGITEIYARVSTHSAWIKGILQRDAVSSD